MMDAFTGGNSREKGILFTAAVIGNERTDILSDHFRLGIAEHLFRSRIPGCDMA